MQFIDATSLLSSLVIFIYNMNIKSTKGQTLFI